VDASYPADWRTNRTRASTRPSRRRRRENPQKSVG
jgi:hypothetical protein